MGRKLYVGNIPYTAGEAELQTLFSQAGTVDTVNVVTDRATGRPRGFAFVEMTTDEEAAKAVSELDQTDFDGRRITVNEARPREPRGDGGFNQRSEPRW
jgi:RNA recognition motif-containing protein